MPLPEKARVEVYIPDLPAPAYQELLERLARKLPVRSRCSNSGSDHFDLYRFANALSRDLPILSNYADELRDAAFAALDEEAVLVTVPPIYHPS